MTLSVAGLKTFAHLCKLGFACTDNIALLGLVLDRIIASLVVGDHDGCSVGVDDVLFGSL